MSLTILSMLKRLVMPFGAMLVLSACNVSVDEGWPHYPPVRPQQPQMCTMEYAPVCAVRQGHGQERTFSNSCTARAAGYSVRRQGECRPSQSRPPHWQPEQSQRPERPSYPGRPGRPGHKPGGQWGTGNNGGQTIACTREFAPVCASDGRRNQTFTNTCEARNAGFRQLHKGECR